MKGENAMSYPSSLDLCYGSEKPTADNIGRLSFGSKGGGSTVLFRSDKYRVGNEYTIERIQVDDFYYIYRPVFTSTKEAYTEVEIERSDWDSIPSDYRKNLDWLNLHYKDITEESTVCDFVGEMMFYDYSYIGLGVPLVDTDNMVGGRYYPPCTLTGLRGRLYKKEDVIDAPPNYTELCRVTIRTYIDGVENTDPSYIPVYIDNEDQGVSVTRIR